MRGARARRADARRHRAARRHQDRTDPPRAGARACRDRKRGGCRGRRRHTSSCRRRPEPNVNDLDLDRAGIRYAPSGIVVDRRLLTSNKRVYAIGDVTDAPTYTHVAYHHAGLVIRHALFRMPIDTETHALPLVTFTDPQLAQVGLTEAEARAASFPIRVLRWPYRENERAQSAGLARGHIKVVTDRNGSVLGATIAGAGAAENIALWSLAVGQTMNIEALAGV